MSVYCLLPLLLTCGHLSGDDTQLPAVEVKTTQSDSAFEGIWLGIDDDRLQLRLPSGVEQSIAVVTVQSIRFSANSVATAPAEAGLLVTLQDGSSIFPHALTSDGREVSMKFGPDFAMVIPTSEVNSIRLRQLTGSQQTQWDAILDSRITGDMLVLARSPDSLDSVEGIVGSISEETIQFDFGDQRLDAPRNRLAGIRYFSVPADSAKIMGTAVDCWGNRWNLSKVNYLRQSRAMELTLVGGRTISIPIEQLQTIDFSAGSIRYLADLTPIGRGRNAGLDLGLNSQVMDSLFGSQPYHVPKTPGPSLRFTGSGWATYRVPAEYTRLAGRLYLAPSGNQFTGCRVEVRVENEVVWEQELTQVSQRLDLSIPVTSDKRVRLSVTALEDYPVGDIVIWQELRFLR